MSDSTHTAGVGDPGNGSLSYRSYLLPVVRELPRLLSWQDREPFSKTYGGFDRTYWGWKFTDFPGARFQEGVCTLAHLYTTSFDGNPYHRDPRLLDWIAAGLRYWQSIQYADGSFDEAYPFEHSLAATAFTVFYLGEAMLLLGDALPADSRAGLIQTFARAGRWLCRNDEHHGILSNHLAAAAAALDVAGRLCGEDAFFQRRQHFLQRIYAHQSTEGWYEEYGGADIGYQTHGTFYLARIWQRTQDPELLESLRRATAFLAHGFHPNGTLGGEYGSRNTEFYFPAGFEILAPVIPAAAAIAAFMRPAVAATLPAGVPAMDAYNFLPMMNNYLFAAAALGGGPGATPAAAGDLKDEPAPSQRDSAMPPLPWQTPGEYAFPDAGLLFVSTPRYYATLGCSKGGTLKVFDKTSRRLVASDCGYWARLDGRIVSSQSLHRVGLARAADGTVTVTAPFAQVNQRVQTPWTFMAFRLFSLTLGRIPAMALWVKNLLVTVLVRRRKTVALELTRVVSFAADRISIRDQIRGSAAGAVSDLQAAPKFATIHMGSSRYFQSQELEPTRNAAATWRPARQPDGSWVRASEVVLSQGGAA